MPAVVLLVLAILLPQGAPVGFQVSDDPNRLFANREDVASAERAAAIWEAQSTADRTSYEAAWKLARACYWLGGHVMASGRADQYKRGIDAAMRAVEIIG